MRETFQMSFVSLSKQILRLRLILELPAKR